MLVGWRREGVLMTMRNRDVNHCQDVKKKRQGENKL